MNYLLVGELLCLICTFWFLPSPRYKLINSFWWWQHTFGYRLILVVTEYFWLETHAGGDSNLGTDSFWWCQNISGYRLILVVSEYLSVQTDPGGVRTFLGTDSSWWCQNFSWYRLILAGTIQIKRVRIWRLFAHIWSHQNVLSPKLLYNWCHWSLILALTETCW